MSRFHENHIENPGAYENAVQARIKANATIGRNRRWFAADPSREALVELMKDHLGYNTPAAIQAIYDRTEDMDEEEMLPADRKALRAYRNRYINPFVSKMFESFNQWGQLTEGQERAVRNCFAKMEQTDAQREVAKAERAAVDAASQFVGTVKGRQNFTLTLLGTFSYDTQFGTTYGHTMRDQDGNVVIYKGSKVLGREIEKEHTNAHTGGKWTTIDFVPVAKGETVTLKATVKEHKLYEGVKQTLINRPVLV